MFLPIVFILYWFVFKNKLKSQNIVLLISSYVFYSFWDWRFLSLILISTLADYFIGKALSKTNAQNHRKQLLYSSILLNLGLLCFFKYYNFFIDSFTTAFSFFGFFPQLVAGPIERAAHLLPQFSTKKQFTFTNGRDGLRQILWDYLKK